MALSIRNRAFVLFIVFSFGAQSIYSAFLNADYESLICTCNHASSQETHSVSPEDRFFQSQGKRMKDSQEHSDSQIGKVPNCHSSQAKTDLHTCSCKKHDKNLKARTLFSSFYLKGVSPSALEPYYISSELWIGPDPELFPGHFLLFLKPPEY